MIRCRVKCACSDEHDLLDALGDTLGYKKTEINLNIGINVRADTK